MGFNKVHIVGIGGISMSGIAKILLSKGFKVSGSDIQNNNQVELLKNLGADVYIGHKESNFKDVDVLVYTNAVDENNVELKKARRNGIKIYKRAQFIAELFKNKETIAVTGTHGKTTTTSMISSIFINSNLDPSIMLGGNLDIIDGNMKNGDGKYFITEADESDGSLTFFNPKHAVITNIELDHFNYYKSEEELIKKFKEFINKISKQGFLIIWGKVLEDYPQLEQGFTNYYTYGFYDEYFSAQNIKLDSNKSSFDLYINGEKADEITLNIPGKHNILNSLAAYAISHIVDMDKKDIKNGLFSYKGVKRRFEKKGEFNEAIIIDDYAHHPTEIITTIETACRIKTKKIYIVFQPHRYSRTANLMEEFSKSFDKADELILTDIYSASEKPIENVTSQKLYDLIKKRIKNKELNLKVRYMSDFRKIEGYLSQKLQPKDMLLTIGAGNVYEIGETLAGG
ncbi:MAG: UDP-N-acetylmuramate--L-alanine ligase [Halanaerobiales bacterium]|nr:UDP-N-acetylmuramate--L-alanine ligase [Halanaerobiales bacterium]